MSRGVLGGKALANGFGDGVWVLFVGFYEGILFFYRVLLAF